MSENQPEVQSANPPVQPPPVQPEAAKPNDYAPLKPPPGTAQTAPPPAPAQKKAEAGNNIERLMDVEVNVTVRFGKTEMPLREIVKFGVGSMIELNRTIDEPVELLINNYPFARGEVVVIDGYYGVKVTEIGSAEERSRTLLSGANQ